MPRSGMCWWTPAIRWVLLLALSTHGQGCALDMTAVPGWQGKGIGRYMVVKTVEALKAEQIGNICLFADTAGA